MTQNSARTHRCNATSELEKTSAKYLTVGFNSHLHKMNGRDYVQIIATHLESNILFMKLTGNRLSNKLCCIDLNKWHQGGIPSNGHQGDSLQ